jgi:integrase/recombinase XerD
MDKIKNKSSKIIRSTFPRIREFISTKGKRYVVDCRKKGWTGKRLMEFNTKEESLICAKEVKELYYQPQKIRKLSQLEEWTQLLDPYGMSVEECIQWCLNHLKARKEVEKTPFIPELTKEWIDYKFNDPNKTLRPDTLRQIRSFGNMISGDLPDLHIKDLTRSNVEQVLETKQKGGWSKVYRKNYLRYLRGFTRWCMNHKQVIDKDPTQGLQITPELKEVDVLSIDEVQNVCKTMMNPKHENIRAYMAIGLFAGIRSNEISQLNWDDIDLDHQHIVVSSKVSKTKKGRLVPILPVLKKWIETLDRSKPLIPRTTKTLLKHFKKDCPEALRQNVRRHSFATYHLSHFKNCSELAEILGNSEPIIRQHYVRMMNKRDAQTFWKMTPDKVQS